MKYGKLLWMDLEMTGLSPKRDRILEVACIATDWELVDVDKYEAAVKCSEKLMQERMVGEFWDKNELARKELQERSRNGKSPKEVEAELLAFIKKNFNDNVYLAGNSIHQDRKFIEAEWPELNKRLHYRMLDVSSWKIYYEGAKGLRFPKPEGHRAMGDILGSMEEFKWYNRQSS